MGISHTEFKFYKFEMLKMLYYAQRGLSTENDLARIRRMKKELENSRLAKKSDGRIDTLKELAKEVQTAIKTNLS